MARLGKFEVEIAAAVVRLGGRATAAQIFQEILTSGERALLANVYVTLERLESKATVIRSVERQVTADGASRNVNVYTLTDVGRDTLNDAIARLTRSVASLRAINLELAQ